MVIENKKLSVAIPLSLFLLGNTIWTAYMICYIHHGKDLIESR
jgi:hypothetical protein